MSVTEIVTDQFSLAQDYANDAIESANAYLATLAGLVAQDLAGSYLVNDSSYTVADPAPIESPSSMRPEPPTNEELTPEYVEEPVEPSLTALVIPDLPAIPTMVYAPPEVTYPEAPDSTLPDEPTDVPEVSGTTTTVASPTISLPDVPVFEPVSIKSSPELQAVEWEGGSLPVNDIVPPAVSFVWSDSQYRDDLLTIAKASIQDIIQNGWKSVPPEITAYLQAGYDREVSQLEDALAEDYRNTVQSLGAMGWSIPAGPELAAREAWARRRNRALTDLANKYTELFFTTSVELYKFATDRAVQLLGTLIQENSQMSQRALEAAKYAVQAGIDAYNVQVTNFNLQLESYKTAATVYESKIRAGLLELENYKNYLLGLQVTAQLQSQEVELYKAQVSGQQALIELYKADLSAINAQLEQDKLRLEVFGQQVSIYTAQINAKTAAYNLYQAQLSGEGQKVDLYGKQVAEYDAEVRATSDSIKALQANMEMTATYNEELLKEYTNALDVYKIKVGISQSAVDTVLKTYGTEADVYKADISAYDAEVRSAADIYSAQVQQAKAINDLLVEQQKANLEAYTANRSLAIEAAKAGATVEGQIAASALAVVHTSASTGADESFSQSQSTSTSTSTSTQYIYSG